MAIKYVLITPAKNEEAYIEKTLQSVIAQTIRPKRWIIVDDNSTDRTAEIVRSYLADNPFIQLIDNANRQNERSFASKSKAIANAYESLRWLDFDYFGNLDADIGLEPTYYESILSRMEANSRLGLAGGIRYDQINGKFELRDNARNSVGGPIQLFRRDCYEMIGGYMALPYGGIDAAAEISARMHGWEVRSFPEYRVYHYRATGTANRSFSQALWRAGMRDFSLGYHPLFEFAHVLNRLNSKPYFGSLIIMLGYLSAMLRGESRAVPPEMVAYLQKEQMSRLKQSVLPLAVASR